MSPFTQGLLAELEAEDRTGRSADQDRRSAGTRRSDGRTLGDAFLYRIRGEILLKREPENSAPAEEAFLTAIAVANSKRQKPSSCAQRYRLAKLYHDRTVPPKPMRCWRPRSKASADAGISRNRRSAGAARCARGH